MRMKAGRGYSLIAFLVSMLVAGALVVQFGCASFTLNAARAGAVSKSAYDMVLSGMGDLYKAGLIKESVKDSVIKIADAYKDVHNKSIEALAKYREKGSPQDKQAYLQLAAEASTILAQLINYARPYLIENGKEVP